MTTEKLLSILIIGTGIYIILSRPAKAAEKPSFEPYVLPKYVSPEDRYDYLIKKWAYHFGLDPAFVKAVIKVESGFRANATDPAYTSFGLMQLTMPTAKWLGYKGAPEGLFDPDKNIYYGCKYLAWLKNRPNIHGDLELMARGYNGGPDLEPAYATKAYAKKVMYWYRYYKQKGI